MRWYLKAAEQGHAWAQGMLGICYCLGKGVEKNEAEAVKWYLKAAVQGNSCAMHDLGYCYDKGIGVEPNKTIALMWYQEAKKLGNEEASWAVGLKMLERLAEMGMFDLEE